MLTRERVHEIFGIKESYKLPDKMIRNNWIHTVIELPEKLKRNAES